MGVGDLLILLLVLMWLAQRRKVNKVRVARRADMIAEEELRFWLNEHPDQGVSWPRAQQLLLTRLGTWREYVRVCPELDDGGILEGWLRAYLEKDPDSDAVS